MDKLKKLFPIKTDNYSVVCILLALVALAITGVTFLLLPQSLTDTVKMLVRSPQVILFNLLAVIIVCLFIYFLSGRIWMASLITGLLFFVLFTVNKYKTGFRGDPLMPADFFLGLEAMSIMGGSGIKIGLGIIFLGVLIAAASLSLILIKLKKPKPLARIAGCFICLVAAVSAYSFLYTSKSVYASIPIRGNPMSSTDEYNSKGYLTALLYNFGTFKVYLPDGYTKEKAIEILESQTEAEYSGMETKPDIFIVMSESFWDITQLEALDFSAYGDPISNYSRLFDEAISGDMYVCTFGGGTDNTEFNVLTGLSGWLYNASLPSTYKLYLRKNVDALPWLLRENGYSAVAIHPGHKWFYNRQNVYNWLGFEEFISLDSFSDADTKGNYVSDAAMNKKIIETYERNISEYRDKPSFIFTVSIQNHGPYDGGYIYGETETTPNFSLKDGVEISESSEMILTNYILGLKDSDKALGELVDYLEGSDRPAVLLFFGDHLPIMGNNYMTYNELGYPVGFETEEAVMNTYRSSYIIWANEKCRKNWDEYTSLCEQEPNQLSANSIGIYLMDMLGIGLDNYFSFLNSFYKSLPVVEPWFYSESAIRDEGFVKGQDARFKELIHDYKYIQYYTMFN